MGYYGAGYGDDRDTEDLKKKLDREKYDHACTEVELERERQANRELREATERRRRQRMAEIEEEHDADQDCFQELEQLRLQVTNLQKVLLEYEPPTLPTICVVCGQEYAQEVRYYAQGHDPRCPAPDRHAHPTTNGEICAKCRQGASP
jgi:hypothetical protein